MTTITERELLEQALEQLRCNAENMQKGMSKSIQKLCARENAKVLERLRTTLAAPATEPEKCGHCGRRTIDPPWPVRTATAPDEQLRKDAERYATLRRGQKWSVVDGIGNTLRAEELDAAIDAAMKGTP